MTENVRANSSGGDRLGWLRQDLTYAWRMIRKSPGFSVAAVVMLALGIGGNTAIFTVTNALLLKAFPYRDPHRLVMVNVQRKGDSDGAGAFSLNRYELLRDRAKSFAGTAVWTIDSFNLTGRGEPQQVSVARVSPNFFSLLGVQPQAGRAFVEEEGQPAGKPVVMISDALWHARFGGDPEIVGKTVTLDSAPYTIIGVLPAMQFPFIGPTDVWSPRYFELTFMTPEHLRTGVGYLTAVARLAPKTTMKSAAAEMKVLHQAYTQEFPKAPDAGPDVTIVVGDLQELTVANIHELLLVLSSAVALVLLIACANVASLLLSRAFARNKEIAIRSALGASRGVVIRQLLVESVLLSLISGVLGFALGVWGTRLLNRYGQANLPPGFTIAVDGRVLGFALLVSVMTGMVFGSFPALKLSRTEINSELRDEGKGAVGGHRRVQAKNLLVVFQIAVCMLLLIAASLMIRSFERLQAVELGFDASNVLTMNVALPTVKYAKPEQQIAFFDELLRKVKALPGVRDASISAALPLTPRRISPVLAEGQQEVPLAERPFVIIEAIGTDWFQTMRVPVTGRSFTEQDNAQAPRVVIVNEALARRFWPNENPIGKHIAVGRRAASEIVGIAANVKNSGLATDPQAQVYLPFPQLPWGNMNLLVRTALEPHQLVASVRQQVYAMDADQPVTNVFTAEEVLDASRAQPRFTMFLLTSLSVIALILALLGIYGVIAYMVAQRRQEMGIRMALGAERADVLRLVVGRGLLLTCSGVVVGLIAALASSRLMEKLLFQVHVRDARTFVLTALGFVLVALAASYFPARRAMRVDPSEALRR